MVFGKKVFAESDPNDEEDDVGQKNRLEGDVEENKNRLEGDVEENQEMSKEDGDEDEDDKFPFVEGPPPDDENCFCFCFCEKEDDDSLRGLPPSKAKVNIVMAKNMAAPKNVTLFVPFKDPEDEEEEDLVDPQDELKESCSDKKECQSLKERLDECNARVESRSKTSENCMEEIIDFMHCVDHCVSKTLFSQLK